MAEPAIGVAAKDAAVARAIRRGFIVIFLIPAWQEKEFFFEKRTKKLLSVGIRRRPGGGETDKGFLLLFFKKEVLLSFLCGRSPRNGRVLPPSRLFLLPSYFFFGPKLK
jgi:hypothetical protein